MDLLSNPDEKLIKHLKKIEKDNEWELWVKEAEEQKRVELELM